MAARILEASPPEIWRATLVPVPPAPRRLRSRGFDPAAEIAMALAALAGAPVNYCLDRTDGPRQVGRSRRERLLSPPSVLPAGSVPPRAILVDDVRTTGATLAACAAALRAAGSESVVAVSFAQALGGSGRGA